MSGIRQRRGYASLLSATEGDPFIRYEIPDVLAATWWETEGAVALQRRRQRDRRLGYLLLGDDVGVGRLVAQLATIATTDGIPPGQPLGVTVPQHLEALLREHFRVQAGGDWEWFWTTSAPAWTPDRDDVAEIDDVSRGGEIAAFLETHSPTADTAPGGGERWFAIEGEHGRLAAVTAYGSTAAGAPHLSSVAVDSALRGQGLGRRIVAEVTRRAVHEHGVCTLGMYSHNTVARRLYLALGYDNPHAWASRAVSLLR